MFTPGRRLRWPWLLSYAPKGARSPEKCRRGPAVFWLVRGSLGARYEKPQTASAAVCATGSPDS